MFPQLSEYKNFNDKSVGIVEWESPSNIALIKYWGKKDNQLPENENLSFGLKKSFTRIKLEYKIKAEKRFNWRLLFEGKIKAEFHPKIELFFEKIRMYYPFIDYADLNIESSNSFPHSSGIASSASSMSALALSLTSVFVRLSGMELNENEFLKRASFIARLGSGSACRSVYSGYSVWGYNKNVLQSRDDYAIKLDIPKHNYFKGLRDAILIVSEQVKALSSSEGHGLMRNHPYARERYKQAEINFNQIIQAFKENDKGKFISIVEKEAMSLHAMMILSGPEYLLLKANSLNIIEKIKVFRAKTGVFICFTIDAGPNIHLLYHENDRKMVSEFIENDLKMYCQNGRIIYDGIGSGPKILLNE